MVKKRNQSSTTSESGHKAGLSEIILSAPLPVGSLRTMVIKAVTVGNSYRLWVLKCPRWADLVRARSTLPGVQLGLGWDTVGLAMGCGWGTSGTNSHTRQISEDHHGRVGRRRASRSAKPALVLSIDYLPYTLRCLNLFPSNPSLKPTLDQAGSSQPLRGSVLIS